MSTLITLGIAVCLCNPVFVAFSLFAFWMGRKISASGKAITDTGIAPKGSGFFGEPKEDVHVSPLIGTFFRFGGGWWKAAGWFSLAMMVLWNIVVLIKLF